VKVSVEPLPVDSFTDDEFVQVQVSATVSLDLNKLTSNPALTLKPTE
jgi:hypothetical protein